jgi:hypothetical protein
MWRDAERICKTPLPVETITCSFTGRKGTNISDESWWCTKTVYNVRNFRLLEQYLGRLSTATRRVSIKFKLYDHGLKYPERIQCEICYCL